MDNRTMQRREFLARTALAASGVLLHQRLAFANTGGDSRLVLVILRGALDGLAAVPPYGDPDYARLRGELALAAPGAATGALRLDATFALHPQLAFLHECFAAGELAVFHAMASAYRERSHFDGQDVLESGCVRPHASQSGWLNRALTALPAVSKRGRQELGVALGQNIPLVMRGASDVASWSPSKLAALDEDTLQRVTDLYAGDALLSGRLADALAANAIVTQQQEAMQETPQDGSAMQAAMAQDPKNGAAARYVEVVRAAAAFLRREDGPRVAVFDTTGWDTHANEGAAQGQLAARLGALDAGVRALKDGLGPTWRHTAVVAVTEFGRTAAVNGTRGTDHGTATAAFLVGGAVRGGRVIAQWPGLSARSLYQQRDLAPTSDLRAMLKGVLRDHLDVPPSALEDAVFPQSAEARPMRDLIRG
jgi:uncharacterized protein (DUF1501 family)